MRVRFALAIAFSTACNCWARSRHERPASIISTMLRRWPSARRSRFTISGCVAWSVSYAMLISYPGEEDMSTVKLFPLSLEDPCFHVLQRRRLLTPHALRATPRWYLLLRSSWGEAAWPPG